MEQKKTFVFEVALIHYKEFRIEASSLEEAQKLFIFTMEHEHYFEAYDNWSYDVQELGEEEELKWDEE